MKIPPAIFLCRLLPLLILGASPALAQDDDLPSGLGRELHALVQWHRAQPATPDAKTRRSALTSHLDRNRARIQTDDAGAVIVNIHLDGTRPAAVVKESLTALGLTITSEHAARRADGRDGTLSAHLPLGQAAAAAKVPGVFSVLAARRPHVRVGKVTSQGVAALYADKVQASGYSGLGISVGVLSDSYNVATKDSAGYAPSTNALQDIQSGDLPDDVVVLRDGSSDPDAGATDEGRAMLQIVHDVAPGANLAFCYSGDTQNEMADNIRLLRTNTDSHCDIIADDVIYFDEPFFSDGPAAQAVDEVVTSTSLDGNPVMYYSAAGNEGDLSYEADFVDVSDAVGRAAPEGVRLDQVPSKLTAGGFHNFKFAELGRGKKIVQTVKVSYADATINFQWDDPFISGEVTTDYNLLVFDSAGNYRDDLSGVENNFDSAEAAEVASLPLNDDGSETTYRLVLSRASGGTGTAKHLRYIVQEGDTVVGKYLHTAQPTIYGHPAAANADGVAAYDVHDTSTPEAYESFGPVTIYFDTEGNRLKTPEVRQQPTIAAVDGVDTTFFPEGPLTGDNSMDTDDDGFPNFYGTSAATPHAAGVAALLLEAAGGKGKLTAAKMRALLESSTASHDLDPGFSIAAFSSADGLFTGTLTARGDASNNSAFDAQFFTLTYSGPDGSSLHKAIINLGAVDEDFDKSTDNGFPFAVGYKSGVDVTGLINRLTTGADGVGNAKLLVRLPRDNFPSGGTLSFGIDRDDANAKPPSGGNSADLLAGATVTIKFILSDGTTDKAVGTFANKIGVGYSPDVGYGLINADAALEKLKNP